MYTHINKTFIMEVSIEDLIHLLASVSERCTFVCVNFKN